MSTEPTFLHPPKTRLPNAPPGPASRSGAPSPAAQSPPASSRHPIAVVGRRRRLRAAGAWPDGGADRQVVASDADADAARRPADQGPGRTDRGVDARWLSADGPHLTGRPRSSTPDRDCSGSSCTG